LYDIDIGFPIEMMWSKMLQRLIKYRQADAAVPPRSPLDVGLGFTIRFAYADDDAALKRLAALDSQPVPEGPLLVAEVGGELWAAVTIAPEPIAIADPFRPTAELVALLRERVARLTGRGRHTAPARRSSQTRAAVGCG
jgi:hypothetical protein